MTTTNGESSINNISNNLDTSLLIKRGRFNDISLSSRLERVTLILSILLEGESLTPGLSNLGPLNRLDIDNPL